MSEKTFDTVADQAAAKPGWRLFTVLAWDAPRSTLCRAYTSHPVEYPAGGEKQFSLEAPWVRQVIVGRQAFLGPDPAAVASVFVDHELIESLGCGAVVNVPVVHQDEVIGVLNLLDAEGSYNGDSVAAAAELAPLAVAPLVEWHAARIANQH